jgi:hypothetical protein
MNKADHRRELKTNDLADALAKAPESGWRYLTPAITVVLVGVLVYALVRYRANAAQERMDKAADNLAVAREEIDQLKLLAAQGGDPSQASDLFQNVNAVLDSVLANLGGSDPKLAAQAMAARGDLDWNMAGFAAATTQPLANQQPPSQLLTSAASAYQQVIQTYPQQSLADCTARFGLAAIDENRQDWDAAHRQYQAVLDDPNAGDLFKALARELMTSLKQLQEPLVIGATTRPAAAAAPATAPATDPAGGVR